MYCKGVLDSNAFHIHMLINRYFMDDVLYFLRSGICHHLACRQTDIGQTVAPGRYPDDGMDTLCICRTWNVEEKSAGRERFALDWRLRDTRSREGRKDR